MKQFFLDANTVLHNIGGYAWAAAKHITKVLGFFAAVLAIALSAGYVIVKFPLYSAIAAVLGAVVTVFVIEFKTVRWIRENEEKDSK